MLAQKYRDLGAVAMKLGITDYSLKEEGGKAVIRGTAPTPAEKNQFWDEIKKFNGWQSEVAADIKTLRVDEPLKTHTVKPGDTLSAIAKTYLGDANRYMEIFNANTDKLKDPNLIQPGQQLVIPKK